MKRFFFVVLLLMPQLGMAADEVASFAAFYQTSGSISWLLIGAIAVAVGAAVFFTGGAASPAVVSIGSWIGGTMGLSGAAATNAGLALLGGGSIASGGLGMLGGTALLTAALTFSTEVVVDYSVSAAWAKYEYHDLVKRSRDLPTLPLPKNAQGLEKRIKSLSSLIEVGRKKPVIAPESMTLVRNVITELEAEIDSSSFIREEQTGLHSLLTVVNPVLAGSLHGVLETTASPSSKWEEQVRLHGLLSLLQFIASDYRLALKSSERAVQACEKLQVPCSLPHYIRAVSELYEEQPNWQQNSMNDLRAALMREPNNKLIPLLVAIYVDRLSERTSDGTVGPQALEDIAILINHPSLNEHRVPNQISLVIRYFAWLKLEQQKVGALSESNSDRIQRDPYSVVALDKALTDYSFLLMGADTLLKDLQSANFSREDEENLTKLIELFKSYSGDYVRLETLVKKFRERQVEELRKRQAEELRKWQAEQLSVRQAEELRKRQAEELREKQAEEQRKQQLEDQRKQEDQAAAAKRRRVLLWAVIGSVPLLLLATAFGLMKRREEA